MKKKKKTLTCRKVICCPFSPDPMCGAFSFAPHQCHSRHTTTTTTTQGSVLVCVIGRPRVRATQFCGRPKPSANLFLHLVCRDARFRKRQKKIRGVLCVHRGTNARRHRDQEGTTAKEIDTDTHTHREREENLLDHSHRVVFFFFLLELGSRFQPPRMR